MYQVLLISEPFKSSIGQISLILVGFCLHSPTLCQHTCACARAHTPAITWGPRTFSILINQLSLFNCLSACELFEVICLFLYPFLSPVLLSLCLFLFLYCPFSVVARGSGDKQMHLFRETIFIAFLIRQCCWLWCCNGLWKRHGFMLWSLIPSHSDKKNLRGDLRKDDIFEFF